MTDPLAGTHNNNNNNNNKKGVLGGTQLAALMYAPVLCTAPLIGFAYYAAIESGRVTAADFFISSAIDLGLANRVGGTGVALLIVALTAALCVRAAFVAQLGAELRAAVHGSAGSDWNQWSVRCALSGAAIGIAVTHFNYAFNSYAHLSLAFATFLLIGVAVLAQCAVDGQLEDLAASAERAVLLGDAPAGLPSRLIAAALIGGLLAHCRLRRWLAAAVVLGFLGMFATITFSLALSSACELVLVAALIASIASWAPDLARVRLRFDFAPQSAGHSEGVAVDD